MIGKRKTSRWSVGQINRRIHSSRRRSGLPDEGAPTCMKFFTPDRNYYDGQPTPLAMFRAYKAYIQALKGILPDTFIKMATDLFLHDAEFETIDLDRKGKRMRVLLKAWSKGGQESVRVRLDYRNATIAPGYRADFRKLIARRRKTCIIDHEGDVSVGGQCEHRILCFPHAELVIWCSDCKYVLV